MSEGDILTEYYFDVETSGTNFEKEEIITIQWQRLGFSGEPIGKLNILKSWESSEKRILSEFLPNLRCYHWDFVFVGKNLLFDFNMLNQRMKYHNLGDIDIRCLSERVILDIKPLLVLVNGGRFIGYDKTMPKSNPIKNEEIPNLYREKNFPKIIQYIVDETKDFTNVFQFLKKEMPKLKEQLISCSP